MAQITLDPGNKFMDIPLYFDDLPDRYTRDYVLRPYKPSLVYPCTIAIFLELDVNDLQTADYS